MPNLTLAELTSEIQHNVRIALAEDIGSGDITAQLIPADRQASATVITREDAVICGTAWVDEVFRQLDPATKVIWQVSDGDKVSANQSLFSLKGSARSLLSGERCALNFLQTLSAVATHCQHYADLVAGTTVKLLDTRKTIPGLRLAQKYAVRVGGGTNHRIGLHDAVLIKENHIAAAGGVTAVLRAAQQVAAQAKFIEIEVETLEQLQEALDAGAKMVLLDNMPLPTLREAVRINAGRAILEISGGVTLDGLRALAETGVDRISIGTLTKDVKATDFSMRLQELE